MYFNHSNSFFHGIMFHHFHDGSLHKKSQGSISKDDFYKLIKFIGKKNILDANIFFEKFLKKKLKKNEVCITFDDALKSQVDIALPVLEDLKIKSFFFVYTSIFDAKPDNLEIFRYFRTHYFNKISDFYKDFYKMLNKDLQNFYRTKQKRIKNMTIQFPMYSHEDIKFRLVRDFFLKKNEYEKIIFKMMKEKKFSPKKLYSKLFFSKKDLKNLNELGHLIGPHSHSHPTLIEKMKYDEQKNEYSKSISIISKIIKKEKKYIKWMSHPNGSYNHNTLKILKELGIKLGFKQFIKIDKERRHKKINTSFLEIAREDHSNIIRKMKI